MARDEIFVMGDMRVGWLSVMTLNLWEETGLHSGAYALSELGRDNRKVARDWSRETNSERRAYCNMRKVGLEGWGSQGDVHLPVSREVHATKVAHAAIRVGECLPCVHVPPVLSRDQSWA